METAPGRADPGEGADPGQGAGADRFVVERPSGGGTGTLWRAFDRRLGRRVALRRAAGTDPVRDLADEAAALTASAHPHVLVLHEAGVDEGGPWLCLALVEGPDLGTLIGGRPLPGPRAVALLTQLGAAVDAVHAAGWVHLDVKPANVLVARPHPADTEHVVLADFGLARRYAEHPDPTDDDVPGDFVGSPAYAAPEHLRGEAVGPAADVYAFTCVAVACFTGAPPWTGGVAAVIEAHHEGAVPPTGLGPGVDAVVARGLAAHPSDRFASAGETARALAAALGDTADRWPAEVASPPRRWRPPTPPASDGWVDRARPAARVRTVPVALLALLVLVLAVVLVGITIVLVAA